MLAPLRRARGLAALGAAGLVLTLAPAALADSTDDAKAKAASVLTHVRALQARVERAERAYDHTLAAVAESVNTATLTERASEAVTAKAAKATAALNDRVRGLYMSGGPLALYATLLSSGSVSDFQNRAVLVDHVVSADRALVDANAVVVAKAARLSSVADHRAKASVQTERSVARAATTVLRLLDQQQQLLDEANAQVAHLQALDDARAALAAQNAAFGSITAARLATLHVLPASPLYFRLYHRAAATCPGLSWTVLAAIGQVESGHGRNPSTSYAGAMGPMQFLPATFASYAVDGDGDGRADIMSPYDAIFTAARYLCANGAGRGSDALYQAIWHYNHADWYVQMVLALARQYAEAPS
jgi:peptidoglycan hydrolase CwlO-like protein